MKKYIKLSGYLLFLLVITSCNKQNVNPTVTATNSDLLTLSPWVIESAVIDFNGQTITPALSSCNMDDIATYNISNDVVF